MNRYDSSTSGRFISPDKGRALMYQPSTLNRYIYSIDDPINYTDADGHFIGPIPPSPPAFIFGGASGGSEEPEEKLEIEPEPNAGSEYTAPTSSPFEGNCRITSPYGTRVNPITGQTQNHTGVDITTDNANTALHGLCRSPQGRLLKWESRMMEVISLRSSLTVVT
jgi:hypothetical protein